MCENDKVRSVPCVHFVVYADMKLLNAYKPAWTESALDLAFELLAAHSKFTQKL